MELTQDTLAGLIYDQDDSVRLDPALTMLTLAPQELADLATLLLMTANRIHYDDPGW